MKKSYIIVSILLIINILTSNAQSQNDTIHKNDILFESDSLLHLTIISDFKTITCDVKDDRKYHNASLLYKTANGTEHHLPVKIKTRGNFRRNKANCDFPPLKIKFPEMEKEGTIFENNKNLKFVTHCKTNHKTFEQALLQEYLVYKLYNILTEKSFKVRLLKIKYLDALGEKDPIEKFSFAIENEHEMAKRLGGKIIELQQYKQTNTERNSMITFCIFQYLIGNTDWSVPALHNVTLMYVEGLPIFAIPYDFDWAGMVNCPYATPDPLLNISSVRERVYRGYEYERQEYQSSIDLFKAKKSEIYGLYANFPYLNHKQKKMSTDYLDSFYKILEDENLIKTLLIKNARSID